MSKFDTDIGKIYCSYNEDDDRFIMLRVVDIYTDEDDNKFCKLIRTDENSNFILDYDNKDIDKFTVNMSYNEFETKIKKDWTLLKSHGIVSITNIIAIDDETHPIKDVILIFFPNHKISLVPDPHQPYAIARQGINNIFADMACVESVGMSVSIDTLPNGFSLSDFMQNESTINSRIVHLYNIDTERSLGVLLKNDETDNILEDLYHHALIYKKNTVEDYKEPDSHIINGYCKYLTDMIKNTGFMDDVYNCLGIIKIDKPLVANEPLDIDDKLLLSTMCGGIRIDKCVPLKFDFYINLEAIKMKFMMVMDSEGVLWIVPYTEFPDEVPVYIMYKLTEDRTNKLQERLIKCVKAYDQSKGIKSGTPDEMF